MRKIAIAFLILSLLTLFGCRSTQLRKQQMPVLNGIIYDRDNTPVDSAMIQVDGKDTVTSDANGRFIITNLKSMTDYHILAAKTGYETLETTLQYSAPGQVLYLRMFSAVQLTNEAERAITERKWDDAETFLNRAKNSGGEISEITYMTAVIATKRGEYDTALALLESASREVQHNPYIDLFLADLYQYHFNDLDKAREKLQYFLRFQHDYEVERRYQELMVSAQ